MIFSRWPHKLVLTRFKFMFLLDPDAQNEDLSQAQMSSPVSMVYCRDVIILIQPVTDIMEWIAYTPEIMLTVPLGCKVSGIVIWNVMLDTQISIAWSWYPLWIKHWSQYPQNTSSCKPEEFNYLLMLMNM